MESAKSAGGGGRVFSASKKMGARSPGARAGGDFFALERESTAARGVLRGSISNAASAPTRELEGAPRRAEPGARDAPGRAEEGAKAHLVFLLVLLRLGVLHLLEDALEHLHALIDLLQRPVDLRLELPPVRHRDRVARVDPAVVRRAPNPSAIGCAPRRGGLYSVCPSSENRTESYD